MNITLDQTNLDKLLAACKSPRDKLLVLLFSQAGLRVPEVSRLQLKDLDLENGMIVIPARSGSNRRIALTQDAVETIQSYLPLREYPNSLYLLTRSDGKLMDDNVIRHRIRNTLGRRAGVEISVDALRKLSPNTKRYPAPTVQPACVHRRVQTQCRRCGEKLMATFYISRKKQYLLILEGCGGHDTESRERRLKVAKFIQNQLPDEQFEPNDLYSYDLSLLLEKLNEDKHADVFEAYLNTF